MTWRRLYHLVTYLPADSALVRAQVGEAAQWSTGEHLLASAVDALHVANWQRSARRGSRSPKPMPRPGAPLSTSSLPERKSYTPEELDALLSSRRREEVV